MSGLRRASVGARGWLATLLGVLLFVRLLAPVGFMPAFDHGAVTIVLCPDGSDAATMHAHHGGHSRQTHEHCPYAAASGLGSLVPELPALAGLLIIPAAILLARTYLYLERQRAHERPPSRGPPILA